MSRPQLILVGVLAPKVLVKYPNLLRSLPDLTGVSIALVRRQDQDIPVGTIFRTITPTSDDGVATTRYQLVAVSQQFDKNWEHVAAGWNTICAFRLLGTAPCLIARLPQVSDFYEQRTMLLTLEAES